MSNGMRIAFVVRRRAFLVGSMVLMFTTPDHADAASTVVGPIRSLRDYLEALAFVRMRNRYALVDVAADWCPFCKTIDREILAHPRVKASMARFALLKIDVTGWTAENIELLGHLDVSGPPTVFVTETESGKEMQGTRSLGEFDVGNLVARLESAR